MQLRRAESRDWPRIVALLTAARLPTDDLSESSVGAFQVAEAGDIVVGAVAVEKYGRDGLLRSLVVDPTWRGQGAGRRLIALAESGAAADGIDSLTLLTGTARRLFTTLGYRDIARGAAPAAVQASAEFTHLCPASSDCLYKRLKV